MTKRTTVRLPSELAETMELEARGRGQSVNAFVVAALATEIERVRSDTELMDRLRQLAARDREILDRLAE